jgi:hypothetical protein
MWTKEKRTVARTTSCRTLLHLVCAFVIGLPLFMFTPQSALAAAPTGSFRGNAYGVDVTADVGPTANALRRLGLITCSCVGSNGKTQVVTVNTPTSAPFATVQGVTNTVMTSRTSTEARVRNTSKVTGLSLLGGIITADGVEAVANVVATTNTIAASENGSRFLNLKIAGVTQSANPAINTKLAVPGFGSVVLREVIMNYPNTNFRTIDVNMLRIKIEQQNSLNLPIGSEIIVAHAAAGFARSPLNAIVQGNAYVATSKTSASTVQGALNNLGLVTMGCEGTNNQTIQRSISAVNVPNVVVSGAGRATAFGGVLNGGTVAKTTAQIENVGLLNGLIRADALTVVSQSTFKDGTYSTAANTTSFTNLRVNNQAVAANVARNTRIDLPGFGYLVLNQVVTSQTATSATSNVRAIEVFITIQNASNLPVGTRLVIGYASSGVLGY